MTRKRIPKKSDIKELLSLINRTMDKDYNPKQIKKLINKDSTLTVDEDMLTGCCLIKREGKSKIEISFICIHENYRRKGLAKAFVESLKEKYTRIRLNVKETNMGAISFYKAMGFEERGFVKKYYLDDKGAIVMRWPK